MKFYYALISFLCLCLFFYSVYLINFVGDWSKFKYGMFSALVAWFFAMRARKV